MKRLRWQISTTRPSEDGRLALELGARVGYWPCLEGPFFSVAFGYRRLDVWYGLPTQWKFEAPMEDK